MPQTDRYASLKAHLIKKYTLSTQQKIDSLLKECRLGDKKPSELYTEMKGLGQGHVPPNTVLLLWYRLLPNDMAVQLDDAITRQDAYAAVKKADRLHQIIAAIAAKSKPRQSRSPERSSSYQRSRSQPKTNFGPNKDLCYYHFKYKLKARKVLDLPCAWRKYEKEWAAEEKEKKSPRLDMCEASLPGALGTKRLFIKDLSLHLVFIIDTGAEVSVLPKDGNCTSPSPSLTLHAANGSIIHTYGTRVINMNFGFRRATRWSFISADVPYSIIEADALAHFGWLPDLQAKKLIDKTSGISAQGHLASAPVTGISLIDPQHPFAQVLSQYMALFNSQQGSGARATGVFHHLLTTGEPIAQRPRHAFALPTTFSIEKLSQEQSTDDQLQLILADKDNPLPLQKGTWPVKDGLVPIYINIDNGALRPSESWTRILPLVMLGLRTRIRLDIDASPAEVLFGSSLRLPGEFFSDQNAENDRQFFTKELRQFMRNVEGAKLKCKVKAKNKLIQERLRTALGTTVDVPTHGYGNTNDGNTARKFFSNVQIVSEITDGKPQNVVNPSGDSYRVKAPVVAGSLSDSEEGTIGERLLTLQYLKNSKTVEGLQQLEVPENSGNNRRGSVSSNASSASGLSTNIYKRKKTILDVGDPGPEQTLYSKAEDELLDIIHIFELRAKKKSCAERLDEVSEKLQSIRKLLLGLALENANLRGRLAATKYDSTKKVTSYAEATKRMKSRLKDPLAQRTPRPSPKPKTVGRPNEELTGPEARFEPKFRLGPKGTSTVHWVLEVTPEFRNKVTKMKGLFLGWQRCRIRDFRRLSRCYKC
ncbi:hypothetical protein TKK_0016604 [Trichogramma kaykai]